MVIYYLLVLYKSHWIICLWGADQMFIAALMPLGPRSSRKGSLPAVHIHLRWFKHLISHWLIMHDHANSFKLVCIYIYTHVYACDYIYIYIHIHTHAHVSVCVRDYSRHFFPSLWHLRPYGSPNDRAKKPLPLSLRDCAVFGVELATSRSSRPWVLQLGVPRIFRWIHPYECWPSWPMKMGIWWNMISVIWEWGCEPTKSTGNGDNGDANQNSESSQMALWHFPAGKWYKIITFQCISQSCWRPPAGHHFSDHAKSREIEVNDSWTTWVDPNWQLFRKLHPKRPKTQ